MMTKKTPVKESSELKKTSNPTPAIKSTTALTSTPKTSPAAKEKTTTKVTVHYDVGFPNTLFVRGSGSYLSWEKGVALKNVSANEWVWETAAPFSTLEFKILINDKEFETGENHKLNFGSHMLLTPKFSKR